MVQLASAATGTGTATSSVTSITGVATATGAFRAGQFLSGGLSVTGTNAIENEITAVSGTTLTIKGQPNRAGTFALAAYEPVALIHGEAISGAGIPAGTTITQFDNYTGEMIISQPATATSAGVALTAGVPYNASADVVLSVLRSLGAETSVTGPAGGPFTVAFTGGDGEVNQPQIVADGSQLTPSGTVTVTTTTEGGEGYDTHYHFQYVSQEAFNRSGWVGAQSTPEVDLGSGGSPKLIGQDLPGLQPGESYHYRLIATNTSPGDPVVEGAEQTLTVPIPGTGEGPVACPNQHFRTGPSADLPDCRAYEQLTPVDKEGAQQAFNYSDEFGGNGTLVAEDGEALMLKAELVNWGAGPDAGQSPYFFTRSQAGWQMTSASPQPETGVNRPSPEIFNPGLTQFGFEYAYNTGEGSESQNIEFKAGPPGGPYASLASVPRKQLGLNGGWVAASADFSKLILQVEDRKLAAAPTGTKSGFDLYEYSAGELRQVNVGIGTCGARIVAGQEESVSSPDAVSADGSRVFFEAVPGGECSQPSHLYIREDGSRTIDLGAYAFAGANPEGSEVLLRRPNGQENEYFIDKDPGEPGAVEKIFSQNPAADGGVFASPDLRIVYFHSNAGAVYDYDTATEHLSYLFQAGAFSSGEPSPDGRFLYFHGSVYGVPGSGQMFLYDREQNMLDCVSCASSFDPEPKLESVVGSRRSQGRIVNDPSGVPKLTLVSANGDFAFFSTPAALLPSDVHGEVEPVGTGEFSSFDYASPSSDIYEWRRAGIDGCAHVQGCLALITDGRGGFLNILLGSTDEGRDVFIYTSSRLVPQDKDTAGDIYDVRIGGGFPPPPPRPVECEGDACSTVPAPPNDLTPSSATFQGAGNLLSGTLQTTKTTPTTKTTLPKARKKCKAKARKCRARSKEKAHRKTRKNNRRRGR